MVFSSVTPERSGCEQVTKRALLDAAIADLEASGLIKAGLHLRDFAAWFLGLSMSRLLSDIDPDLDPETVTSR